jgi:hypothetical protein
MRYLLLLSCLVCVGCLPGFGSEGSSDDEYDVTRINVESDCPDESCTAEVQIKHNLPTGIQGDWEIVIVRSDTDTIKTCKPDDEPSGAVVEIVASDIDAITSDNMTEDTYYYFRACLYKNVDDHYTTGKLSEGATPAYLPEIGDE